MTQINLVAESQEKDAIFVIPVFNDWNSFAKLVQRIDEIIDEQPFSAQIVAVNDGSFEEVDSDKWATKTFNKIKQIEIVDLYCNIGHQRAIAIGLSSIVNRDAGIVIVMDGDGEDDPIDLPYLLKAYHAEDIQMVLAQRISRSEGVVFKLFYAGYKLAFRWLTGFSLSFGNYCVLSPSVIRRLTFMPTLWNSLPASCLRSKIPYRLVPTKRGKRYDGVSQMNFVNLLLHGLQAITVFSDAVLVRLTLGLGGAAVFLSFLVIAIRFLTDWVPLGWASNMLGFMWMGVTLAVFGLISTSLLALQERSAMPLIPGLQGESFVRGKWKLYG